MVVGVGFCKIKIDSIFLLVLKIKCTKFHQDRSKTVDLHTKYTNKQTFSFIYRVSQKWRTNCALRCRRDYRIRQKNVKKILLDLFADLAVFESAT
jgi:hypothetical protein